VIKIWQLKAKIKAITIKMDMIIREMEKISTMITMKSTRKNRTSIMETAEEELITRTTNTQVTKTIRRKTKGSLIWIRSR
jgi:hypothetical protein